jgi:hypothetical protein
MTPVTDKFRAKRGLTVYVELYQHPCTRDDGSIAYHAFGVRWRDWDITKVDVLGDWQGHYSTNIHPVDDIRKFFRMRDYGVRANRRFERILSQIPARLVS